MTAPFRWSLTILVIATAATMVDCLAITRTLLRDAIYNSDVVQPFLVVQGVLSDPGSLFTWLHSPAIYAFPDWIISLVLLALHVPHRVVPIVYASFVIVTAAWLIGLLAKTLGTARSALAGTFAGGAALLLAWLLSLANPATVPMLSFATLPAFHSGAVLGAIYGAWLCSRLMGEERPRLWGLHAAIVFGLCFSDALAFAWMDLPLAMALLLAPSEPRRFHLFLRALPIIVAGAVGVASGLWLSTRNPSNSAYFGRVVRPGEALLYMADFVRANLGDPWFVGMLVLAIFTFAAGLLGVLRAWPSQPIRRGVLLYHLAAIFCALAFPIASGRFVAPDQWRYLAVIPFLGLTWFSLVVVRFRTARVGVVAAAFVASTVVPVVLNPFAQAWGSGMTGLIACLNEDGLTSGYGDYWVAKQVIFLSDRAIHIAQLDGASEMRFNFDARWFTQRADGSAFVPNFIVTDRLNEAQLAGRFGTPTSVSSCAGSTIWHYDHGLRS